MSWNVTDDFERLDRALSQLGRLLASPGDDDDESAELIWEKLGVLYESMGAEALRAMLRRQGLGTRTIDDALNVLDRRRGTTS
jgi:lipoprotein NlpI